MVKYKPMELAYKASLLQQIHNEADKINNTDTLKVILGVVTELRKSEESGR